MALTTIMTQNLSVDTTAFSTLRWSRRLPAGGQMVCMNLPASTGLTVALAVKQSR